MRFALPLATLLVAGLTAPVVAAAPVAVPPADAPNAAARGRKLLGQRTPNAVNEAIAHFERALDTDPGYAPAWAGLADARALAYDYAGARYAAERALQLAPDLAEAHASLGFVRLHAEWDWAAAEASLRRSLELQPQRAQAHAWLALVLEVTTRSDEAVAAARRAVEIEPASATLAASLGYRLFWARRYAEAIAELERAVALDPELETAHYFTGRALVQLRRLDEARAAFARAKALSPGDTNLVSAVAYLDAVSDRQGEALRALAEIEKLAERGRPFASQAAGVRAALGNTEQALDWLDRAYLRHEGPLVWLAIDPRFDPLRGEPRFRSLLRLMRLSAAE